MKKKRIGFVTMEIANDYMNRILTGASDQAAELGYEVCTFLMSFNINSTNTIQDGEENIYRLINSRNVDGLVFITGNAANPELVKKIGAHYAGQGIPIVSVETEYDFCNAVYADDVGIFEKMTDHFIERHGSRKIACLTGFKGMVPSERRLEGYKRSLKKHGIPLRDEYIIYGDYWKPSGVALANAILGGEIEQPDTIVCANDAMAIHLCNTLIDGGLRVPDDIRISGCDCSRDAMDNIPPLTTILPENRRLGASAVLTLHEMMTGIKAEMIDVSDGIMVLSGSCGCSDGQSQLVRRQEYKLSMAETHERYFSNSGMAEALMQACNLDHLLHILVHYMYLLPELEYYSLNLGKNWDSFEETDETKFLREGYPEDMVSIFRFKDFNVSFDDKEYSTQELIPDFIQEQLPENSMYFLMPLHFMDRCFGYSIYKFRDISITMSTIFSMWNRNINLALEFLRVRTKLTAINQRISLSSVRDTLTGIYNRQGFKRFSDSIFRKAQSEGKPFLLLIADLDLLKHINDNFGHVEGDNAITVAANGLNTCCSNNEICARIGGDEYAIVGCYDYTEQIISNYLNYISDYFKRYNGSSEKPYKVDASVGYFCGVPEPDKNFEFYMEIADRRMYENKFQRKKFRTD